jgi:hypothetical protein
VAKDRIAAVALLTQPEPRLRGPSFRRAYLVDEAPCFSELLRAIDAADRDVRRQRDAKAPKEAEAPLIDQPMPSTVRN